MSSTYQAAVCTALTGPDAMTVRPFKRAPLKSDEIRIDVRAAGVNFPDLLLTQGAYQLKLEPPFTPGMEVAGMIIEVGTEIERFAPGMKVIAALRSGGFGEEVAVSQSSVVPLPNGFTFEQGAAFFVAARTAFHALSQRGNLKAGEKVLVLGATGGVGFATVQIAKALGAEVVAVGSSDEKLKKLAQGGADHVINYTTTNLRDTVKAIAAEGVDLVFDAVGDPLASQAQRCLGWHGRYLVIGFAGGAIPSFEANYALLKGHQIIGVRAGEAARRDPLSLQQSVRELLELAERGSVTPHIHRSFPLSDAASALKCLQDRQVIGRVVINPEKGET